MTTTNLLDALPEHVLEAIRVHQDAVAKQRARAEERFALRHRLDDMKSAIGDTLPVHAVEALLIRADALDAQSRASALLREADLLEHRVTLHSRVDALESALAGARAEEESLITAADQAREEERHALAQLTTARENLESAQEAEKVAQKSGYPQTETEALLRVGAAGTIVHRHQAAAEGAVSVRTEAESAVTAARELIRHAQAALDDAKDCEAHAEETVQPSPWTIIADLTKTITSGQQLDADALGVARLLLTGYAQAVGGVIEPAVSFAVERALEAQEPTAGAERRSSTQALAN